MNRSKHLSFSRTQNRCSICVKSTSGAGLIVSSYLQTRSSISRVRSRPHEPNNGTTDRPAAVMSLNERRVDRKHKDQAVRDNSYEFKQLYCFSQESSWSCAKGFTTFLRIKPFILINYFILLPNNLKIKFLNPNIFFRIFVFYFLRIVLKTELEKNLMKYITS